MRHSWHRRWPHGWIRVSLSLSVQILHSWKVLLMSQYSSYCSCDGRVGSNGKPTDNRKWKQMFSQFWQSALWQIDKEILNASSHLCHFDCAPLGWFAQACQVGIHVTTIWVKVAAGSEMHNTQSHRQAQTRTTKQKTNKQKTNVCYGCCRDRTVSAKVKERFTGRWWDQPWCLV